MSVPLIVTLLAAACGALMLLERSGVRTTLDLHFKGDVKRETRWLAQYGQSVCTLVAGVLVWDLDPNGGLRRAGVLVAAVLATSLIVMVLKRLVGRVRPGREQAGRFLGPTLQHANFRESFPSSHTACAVALSVMLSSFYPEAAITFWTMAIACAALRYVLDAHWPSDVVGGVAVGIAVAHATRWALRAA